MQIDWMLQPRDALKVCSGCWAGLECADLSRVFTPSETRRPEPAFFADYNEHFRHFLLYRKNIRPFVQPWAKGITLASAPANLPASDIDDDFLDAPDALGTSAAVDEGDASGGGEPTRRAIAEGSPPEDSSHEGVGAMTGADEV